ncbi:MAG: FAD-dependent oxidoreductase [Methylovulum sp.]|nr:FAD-dependent oxidoreductase [Methylovulum sp.]
MNGSCTEKMRLVVIGNGMAGLRTVEELLACAPDRYEITVFGAEPYGNYNRILLSAVLCGEKQLADIFINTRQWYADNGITLHAGADKAVARIDRARRQVLAEDGTVADYDRLLIATGSDAIKMAIPGHDYVGVNTFRTIADVNAMLAYATPGKQALVLGGGLLGLEAANGLSQCGMTVTVIHNHADLLNKQLDSSASKLLQAELERRGVQFKMQARLQGLVGDGGQHVRAAQFDDGTALACDLFVMAIGVQPNITVAKAAGLACARGIIVNDAMQTSDAWVYAVGECVEHRGNTFGLVAPLYGQAKVCAQHLAGHSTAQFVNPPMATKLKVSGIKLFSVGDFQGNDQAEHIFFTDPVQGIYKKLVVKANQLVGAVLYGDTADSAWYQELVEQQVNVTPIRDRIIFGKA